MLLDFNRLFFLFLLFSQHADRLLHITAQLLGHLCDFQLFGFFCGIGEILLDRGLCCIDSRLDTTQTNPNFLLLPCRIVSLIDRQDLSFFFVGQSEQGLYGVKLVDILSLIQ